MNLAANLIIDRERLAVLTVSVPKDTAELKALKAKLKNVDPKDGWDADAIRASGAVMPKI